MPLGSDRRQRRRRAAVIGGAAVAAKKHHDAKEAEQEQAAAPEQPEPAVEPSANGGLSSDVLDQLKQLGDLHEQNVLSDEEFEREKAKLLG
jgi:Short C-terminal domain